MSMHNCVCLTAFTDFVILFSIVMLSVRAFSVIFSLILCGRKDYCSTVH